MKKFLLIAAIAACSMSANAQMKVDKAKVYGNVDLKFATEVEDNNTRATFIPNMYYYRPNGMFYSGWSKEYLNAAVSYAPANTDITFVANFAEGSTPIWAYPTGEFDAEGKPVPTEYEGNEIVVNLPQGDYFTPIVAEKTDPMEDQYKGGGVMYVGNKGIYRGTTEFEGEERNTDGFASNYAPVGNVLVLPYFFCTNNPDADRQLGGVLGDNFHMTAFGELFRSNADFTVKGFNAFFFAEEGLETKILNPNNVVISFNKIMSDKSMMPVVEPNKITTEVSIVEQPTEVTPQFNLPAGKYGIYHVECSFAEPVQVKAGEIVLPVFRSGNVIMAPMFDGQPRWDEESEKSIGVTTMFMGCVKNGQEMFTSIPSLGFKNEEAGEKMYLTGWMMGLDMSYAEGGAAGIEDIVAEEAAADGAVYSISGVKVANTVENLPAGVYVKDGKKFVVK